ncbi:MAG: tyrosine-type recombinase/integrase [Wenzhouxiangellaceae bacterium]|nr:tyrosine-type recombinase/integrase [Wenzhouxiangellaceae bacterium]MBS3823771.1 tyrosine-type recombinase/integrase [Wenzhouxiangellaceae bacterium]
MPDALSRMQRALRTEDVDQAHAKSLLFWARAFLSFCSNDALERLNRNDVEAFLTHASEERFAGPPARNRALEAIEWLFRTLPDGPPAWLKILIEEHRPGSRPNILTQSEVRQLLARLNGTGWLAAALVYGTGIRLLECVRLRVRDIDLEHDRLTVRDGEDRISRTLPLPENIQDRLTSHLEDLRMAHIRALVEDHGHATLPPPVAARAPNLARKWGWQYLFPERLERDHVGTPEDARKQIVHHIDPQTLHRRFERAAVDANIYRRVTGHVLRNSFALHMIQNGVSVRRLERILGTRPAEAGDEANARSLPIPADGANAPISRH